MAAMPTRSSRLCSRPAWTARRRPGPAWAGTAAKPGAGGAGGRRGGAARGAGGAGRAAPAGAGVRAARRASSLAWALLAVGAPRAVVGVDEGRIAGFADGPNGELKPRMLAAALAGLGRVNDNVASGLGVDVARQDDWTQALDRAAS